MILYKGFGTDILYDSSAYPYRDWNTDEHLVKTKTELPKFLANMPQRKEGDLKANIDLLLGPPTIEAARYFVEIGVYLSSNNLDSQHDLISWIIQNIPWSILGPLLSSKLPTIQAFTEKVLHTAVKIGDISVAKNLLETPMLRAHVQSSEYTLWAAVLSSNAEIVSLVLKAGANPNKPYVDFGDTSLPLHEARTVDIAQMLVEAHADVNAISIHSPGAWKGSALVGAVARGDVAVARYLISIGAGVNMVGENETGGRVSRIYTPLALAANGDQVELVQLLLEEGANVNAVSWTNPRTYFTWTESEQDRAATALQIAAALGHLEVARVLLEAGADINIPACGPNGQTALQAATATGNIEIVELLLANGADVNARSNNNIQFPKTALLTAVEMNNVGLVEVLLAAGADVNTPAFGYFGSTVLEAAKAQANCTRVVEILQEAGAREAQSANDCLRRIQLRDAVWKGDLRRVTDLIQIGIRIDMEIIESENPSLTDKGTILHWALHFGYHENVNVELFRLLVSNIEDVNAQKENLDLEPILHQAIRIRNIQLVEILIEAGADINAKHPQYATPLIMAAYLKDIDIVLFLLNKEADIDAVVEETPKFSRPPGATALQASLASMLGRNDGFQTFHLLLHHGAATNIPITAPRGSTELVYAVRTGNMKIVQCLLTRGADVNAPPAESYGRTALQAAAELRPANLDLVRLLLENGADVNGPTAKFNGITALQAAAAQGHFQIALLFLEAGADVNASRNHWQGRALEQAAWNGRLDLVHLLLKAGADTHLPLEKRYTSATELARREGHIVVAELLEKWKRGGEARSARGDIASTSKGKRSIIELD
jgi:ankyrin repeat protein